MNIAWKALISLFTLSIGMQTTLAETFPQSFALENCRSSGGVAKTRCEFNHNKALDGSSKFSMRWDVDYLFACSGLKTGVSLSISNGSVAIPFAKTAKVATIEGIGPLVLKDLDTEATKRATLIGDCTLTINRVTVAPSTSVLIEWKDDATELVKNIVDARDSLLLADTFTSLAAVLHLTRNEGLEVRSIVAFDDQKINRVVLLEDLESRAETRLNSADSSLGTALLDPKIWGVTDKNRQIQQAHVDLDKQINALFDDLNPLLKEE